MRDGDQRDDRVLRGTRWVSLVIIVVLVPAVVILWGFPGNTATLWAWTIKPDMTPIFMGSAYGGGAYFFSRVAFGRRWHLGSAGVLAVAIFAGLMLVVTFTHFSRFNHGDAPFVAAVTFYAWITLYIMSPFAVAALWLRNRRTDPRRREPGDPLVPLWVRWIARVASAAAFVVGALFMVSAATANAVWAWRLTPLTAGVVGSFTIQVSADVLLLSLDERWSSWRVLLETFLLTTALLLVGAVRAWGTFDHSSVRTWIFVVGLGGFALAILLLFRRMERSGHTMPAARSPS